MAKSILKDNHTQPIESSSQFSQLQSLSQVLTSANRRVSFAREVTLHKIDYIQNPNNKRRKTIAGEEIQRSSEGRIVFGEIPGESFVDPDRNRSDDDEEEDDGGTRMMSDSSDEEENENMQVDVVEEIGDDSDEDNIQADDESEDDKTMDLTDTVRRAREAMREMAENQDDEQTMELTGIIQRQPLGNGNGSQVETLGGSSAAGVSTVITGEIVDQGASDSDDSIKFIKQVQRPDPVDFDVQEILKIEDAEGNREDSNEDDTQPMELTQTLPKTVNSNIEKPVLREITEVTEEEHSHEDSEIDEMVDEIETEMGDAESRINGEPSNGLTEAVADEPPHNDYSEHMDLSLVDVGKFNCRESLQGTHGPDENDISMAMDLTIIQPRRELLGNNGNVSPQIGDSNAPNEEVVPSEQLEETSKEPEQVQVEDPTVSLDESEGEEPMELTQPVQRREIGEGDEENIAFPKKVVEQSEDATRGEASQAMELTQTLPKPMDVVELATQEDEEPMELTQALPQKVDDGVVAENSNVLDLDDAMELTQVVPRRVELDKPVATDDTQLEDAPMDLTQPLPMKVIPAGENPTPMKQVSQTDEEDYNVDLSQVKPTGHREESVEEVMSSQADAQFMKSDNATEAPEPMDTSQGSITEDTSRIEHVVTTTIPLAEITQDDDEEEEEEDQVEDEEDYNDADYTPVTLSKFFNDIGVQFYDDLELDVSTIPRSSITGPTQPPTLHDYIKARPHLGLLELYEFCCQELNKNIVTGRDIYNDFEQNIEANNPVIFKKYYRLDEEERLLTNAKIRLVSDYARLESKKTWYSWRRQLIESLISQLDGEMENLKSDGARLASAIKGVNLMYDLAKQRLSSLKKEFDDLVGENGGDGKPSLDELRRLKDEVAKAKQDILDFDKEIEDKKEEMSDIKESWNSSMELRSELLNGLGELQTGQEVDGHEMQVIYEKYKTIEELSDLQLQDSKISFLFDKSLLVEFDFATNNINYTIEANHFKNDILMQSATKFPINPTANITDQFTQFSEYWECLKKFDFAVYYATLKYPTEVSIKGHSIELKIRYFNFADEYELRVHGSLKIVDLVNFKDSIKFEAKPKRDAVGKDFRTQINHDLKVFPTLLALQLAK
ncbi:hypothetical protein Cantr_06719 [Candida viswanathii]|uniref:Spc7 kinetochore protein domain-containing protein n=1 Tax=Candida viswanathii TaxID=5486 RepID=A0A367XX97_9ASCO|nr:hypothetical protein Cantr_06719 [Candida viswanathii]